jgi:hypothetical protein
MKFAIKDNLIYPSGTITPTYNTFSDLPFLKRICQITGRMAWIRIKYCPFCSKPTK